MKKTTGLFSILFTLLALILSLSLISCGGGEEPEKPVEGWQPTGESITLLVKGQPAGFSLISADDASKEYATIFRKALSDAGYNAPTGILTPSDPTTAIRVVFGPTSDKAVELASEAVTSAAEGNKDLHWAFRYYDGTLSIVANSAAAYEYAIADFISLYSDGTKLAIKDDVSYVGKLTFADYEAKLDEIDRIAAEEKKAENAKLLDSLEKKVNDQRKELNTYKGRINKYDNSTAAIYLFANYTQNIGSSGWGAPPTTPTEDEHPRLLITSDMIPNIRASLREENSTNARFLSKVDAVLDNDGILPEASSQGFNATVDLDNFHNWSAEPLEIIQIKALAYLLYDDPYYGYQAILYIKNYLKSLDIKQIASDQCRQYGYVMFTAAIVYDWCYDLLTEEDKVHLIAGVENCICRGKNNYAAKMEVGFPPSGQGSVSGHGSEYQILRDYLAFSVAIYDENPSWWVSIAGRVYNDYLQVRNYYFQSGMTQQGSGNYIAARHICDLYAGWILQVATGKNPFVGMENTVKSTLGYECAPGIIFNDGDGMGDYLSSTKFLSMAYISAYLYADEAMRAQGDYLYELGNSTFGATYAGLACPAFVALHGLARLDADPDRYASMDLIQYNGYPLGQYIIREKWNDESAGAVFMRIKERSTANHEHRDSGTFEIYYKGALTTDGGAYNNYGHVHTQYYHQATISHNGLIIFNHTMVSDDAGWYSGGQRKLGSESPNLESWLANTGMDTGTVTGRQHGYANEAETQAKYAYIAGDVAKAYDSNTASYVGRRMLTVYTGDAEFPMAFFVYDDITAKNANFEKRFLLQISSKDAPIVDAEAGRVITENGDGRLVLTSLSDDVVINAIGGRNEGAYDANLSQNYLVNGQQLVPKDPTKDDGHWGRVEIVSTKERATTVTFHNVIYVTDKGNENMATISEVKSQDDLVGSVFNDKVAAIFITSRERATEKITYNVSGKGKNIEHYVSGIAAGEWTVTVDGESVGSFTVTEEGGLLTFTAEAGKVVITPAN